MILVNHAIDVPSTLFEELQFRFFKRFNSIRKSANQYGFFDELVKTIYVNDIERAFDLNDLIYVYFFYQQKAFMMPFIDFIKNVNNMYNQNKESNNSEMIFIFNKQFDKLIAISDDELDHQIFFKHV